MSKDDFKILLNSSNTTGNNNGTLNFKFDFSKFPSGYYALTFSFVSRSFEMGGAFPGQLTIDFGSTSIYTTSNSYTSAQHSNFIGFLYPEITYDDGVIVTGFLQSKHHDNSRVILQRPTNNDFNVSVLDFDNVVYRDTNNASLPEYLLVLNFEKISP